MEHEINCSVHRPVYWSVDDVEGLKPKFTGGGVVPSLGLLEYLRKDLVLF